MHVTFLGQAGLFIETRGVSVLCDPWFNPAYFASWFPFPANDHIAPERIGNPTYLYVSHLHHDHYDPRFLSDHVSKETTVILPDYPLDNLEKELRGLGFHRFLKTENGVPFEADGLRMMVLALVAPTDGPIGDSCLLVDDGEVRVLNMNDARPPDPDPMLQFGPIDALFLQFSGAIWYPMVYEFPERMKEALARKKRTAQFARAYRYIELCAPKFTVPSAGPPCFLDDDLFQHNDFDRDPTNIFPGQDVFLEYMAERGGDYGGRLMLPGSVGHLRPGSFEVTHPFPDGEVARIFTDKRAYLEEYQARQRPVIERERASWQDGTIDLYAEIKAWFEPLLEQADNIAEGINEAVLLELGETGIVVDFRTRQVTRWEGEPCAFQFRVDPVLISQLVKRREQDWVNELFLSMRFSAARRGKYNDYVYTWFKCLSEERLQYAEGYYAEQGPTMGTWEAEGYRIQARCPHMKADLERFATIQGNVLTCRLHNWQFDLDTGSCLTAAGHPIWAQRVEEIAARAGGE